MFNLFNKGAPVVPLPEPLPPPWTGMTLARWRESEEHVAFAAELFRDPRFMRMLEVLWSQLPLAPLAQGTDYAAQVGRLQGYREAIAVLLELPVAPAPTVGEIDVDYSGETFDTRE